MSRKIIHIDMDAFFASIEQRDFPHLRGKPVAVGGSRERGVVAAASYEARKFGVRSAMPSSLAYRKCPQIIFTKSRFHVYKAVSEQIRKIFYEYTDLVEPLSLDEAYLDVTENKKGIGSAIQIAEEIRKKISDTLNLTASAGVSYNKFLAKTASDINKPNGIAVILPEEAIEFLEKLQIDRFYGIGSVTAEKMKKLGIFKGSDLKKWPLEHLIDTFGKSGKFYYHIVRGIDNRKVKPSRERKSIGAERTFSKDIADVGTMKKHLNRIAEILWNRITSANKYGKTLTVKVKLHNFESHTKSKTFEKRIINYNFLLQESYHLLDELEPQKFNVRLLGISVSNFSSNDDEQQSSHEQLKLF
ncbi:DNA polymerase IV [Flammeovirga aprica]|uniref:DNA polymerase IV n=1 Tax=Flammeovirga aprica JL-4 TaxID=694437 RepID=A0A7X9RWW1_9BACT|nr:DNA polymerase IV [Flammeovirga aprica]NME70192.1 DNA polymerase IV [Flammeovirga aprica JL-4]